MMPPPDYEPVLTCPTCGGNRFEKAHTATDRHYGNPGSWNVDRCVGCDLLFLNPMPSERILATFYPADYYAAQTPPSGGSPSFRRRVMRYLYPPIKDPVFERPGTMLDIGCGSGEVLQVFRSCGWRVAGAEPNPASCAEGRALGLDIRQGSVVDAGFPAGHFDYVRSNHSFEHIRNPSETLAEIHRIIKPTGQLMVSVPNAGSAVARHFGADWYYLGAPVHTFGYSPRSLRRLLARHGFRVERVRFNSNFRGTVGSLQIRRNARAGLASDEGNLAEGSAPRILGQLLAKGTDLFRVGDCIEITARPIVGFSTTMR